MVKLRDFNGMSFVENDGNKRTNSSLNGRIYEALDDEKDSGKYNSSSHVNSEWNVLDSLVEGKKVYVRGDSSAWDDLYKYVGKNPNSIDIAREKDDIGIINEKEYFIKYFMPKAIPSSIKSGEVCLLEKGDYKGIVFDMPGVEVKINGQWLAYDKSNAPLIKSQNPMTLEWRINADEATKFGGKNLKLKVISVDDQWNRLHIEEEVNIKIENDPEDG